MRDDGSMPITWRRVVELASTWPEVAESTSYGTPCLKVKDTLMARLRTEDDGSLAIKCSTEEKNALVEGDDPAFHTTPHYDGYDYVLVDLALADADQVLELVDAAWWIAAPARVRTNRESMQ